VARRAQSASAAASSNDPDNTDSRAQSSCPRPSRGVASIAWFGAQRHAGVRQEPARVAGT